MGSADAAHRRSCFAACGILLDQGSNLHPLHWQMLIHCTTRKVPETMIWVLRHQDFKESVEVDFHAGMMGVTPQSEDGAEPASPWVEYFVHRSVDNCEGPEILSYLQVNSFMFPRRRHRFLGQRRRTWVWTASGLSVLFGWAPAALQVPQGARKGGLPRPEGLTWVCVTAEEPWAGESIAVTANYKPACSLSGGEVTSSFKVACSEQNPEAWPWWREVGALRSWHSHESMEGCFRAHGTAHPLPLLPEGPTAHLSGNRATSLGLMQEFVPNSTLTLF